MTKSTSSYLNKLRKVKSPFVSLAVIVLVIGVTFSIVLARKSLDTRSRASTGTNTNIIFTDSNDVPITQISSSSVFLRLTSPWPKTASTAMIHDSYDHVLGSANAVLAVGASSDDVTEDGSTYDSRGNQIWIGNSASSANSWTGLRFNNVLIPKGATITSAQVMLYSTSQQWINVKISLYAENTANSQTFSSSSKPSSRARTTSSVNQSFNTKWSANAWYSLNEMAPVIQQVVNRSDWQQGNSLSVLIKGTGKAYARKFASSFDRNSTYSPKLAITFTTTDVTNPTPTTVVIPSASPTILPSATRTPIIPTNTTALSPTPTLVPYTTQVELAEDQGFTVNKKVFTYSNHPLKVPYTFSNSSAGQKLVYARFTSSTGQTQVFSNWIDLVSTPTATPGGGSAINIWGTVDPSILGTCSAAVHDKYIIDGHDGYYYRTWHPQVDPSGCVFAHEHGDDPNKMTDSWVRSNWDGRFGYASRRMKTDEEPLGHMEAHEGFKVFVANIGDVNDEGRVNKTATISTFHMGTGGPKRFTVQHHSNSIAYRSDSGTYYAATHLLMDTGGVSDVCDPRPNGPAKSGILLQNRCKINSAYEIWNASQSIKNGTKEIYRGFATPAVFDPITVFNKDNPSEVVYASDPRVANVKNFPNDNWSGFRGCVRESYAQVGYFYNAGGSTTYYTDAMGMVVSQDDPNAIKQTLSATNAVGVLSTNDGLVQYKKKTSYCQNISKLGLKN